MGDERDNRVLPMCVEQHGEDLVLYSKSLLIKTHALGCSFSQDQVPAHTWWLTSICNTSSKESNALLWPPQAWRTRGTQPYTQANTHTHKNKCLVKNRHIVHMLSVLLMSACTHTHTHTHTHAHAHTRTCMYTRDPRRRR